jgi:hypothetical protein
LVGCPFARVMGYVVGVRGKGVLPRRVALGRAPYVRPISWSQWTTLLLATRRDLSRSLFVDPMHRRNYNVSEAWWLDQIVQGNSVSRCTASPWTKRTLKYSSNKLKKSWFKNIEDRLLQALVVFVRMTLGIINGRSLL